MIDPQSDGDSVARPPGWTAAARWAANQIEGSLADPQGLLDAVNTSNTVRAEPAHEQHTSIVVLSQQQPEALRNRLLSALEGSTRVVVIGGPRLDDGHVKVSDVIGWIEGHATPLDFVHEDDWWGVTLVNPDGNQLSPKEVASDLEKSRNEAVDELKIVSNELATALTENSLLVARLKELADAQRELDDLSVQLRDMDEEVQVAQRTQQAAADRIRDLEVRVKKLMRDKEALKHDLAIERWKLRSMRNRRWWRLGSLMASLVRQPFKVTSHLRSLRQIIKPPLMAERPVAKAQSATGSAKPAASVAAGPGSMSQQTVVAATDFEPAQPPGRLSGLKVAAILDDMSRACFAPECELLTFTPANWHRILSSNPPHVLLVESAWKGNKGSWEYKVGSYSYPDSIGLPDLTALVVWCRARGIPTVFWNKEDPVHFAKFKEAAQLFDVVFTTDADRVAAYRELPGVEERTVAVLPFAAQPSLHYPGPLAGRDPRPVFAGTFYRDRHPERVAQMEMLLDAGLDHDLVIFDRMGGAVTDSFGYPDRFQGSIIGSVPYPEMVEVYRKHRVFLNVNSVVGSPTMTSRRVFELLACGTPVVSTPARGIAEIFGDTVTTVSNRNEASQAIEQLVNDDGHWLAVSRKGVLKVATRHLYHDRLFQIAYTAGINLPSEPSQPKSWTDEKGGGDPASEAHQDWEKFGNPKSGQRLDGLVVIGRLTDCAAIASTTSYDDAYTRVDTLPDGDFVIRKTAIQGGLEPTPGTDASGFGGVFLFPE